MPQAFTVLWSKDHCNRLRGAGDEGKALTVLFGGVHQSAPSLVRSGVTSGDIVFPLQVRDGDLHVLAAAIVDQFIPLDDYMARSLGTPAGDTQLHEWDLVKNAESSGKFPGHRLPYGCSIEVALVRYSTPLRFDLAIPGQELESVRFLPRRGPAIGLRNLRDGKLASSVSIQGNIRRLAAETAARFSEVVGLRAES